MKELGVQGLRLGLLRFMGLCGAGCSSLLLERSSLTDNIESRLVCGERGAAIRLGFEILLKITLDLLFDVGASNPLNISCPRKTGEGS